MWDDLVAWFQSPGGARVLQTAIVPALAILVAGVLAAQPRHLADARQFGVAVRRRDDVLRPERVHALPRGGLLLRAAQAERLALRQPIDEHR